MKQLLIVKSGTSLNAGLPTSSDTGHTSDKEVSDLSQLTSGAITFFELGSKYALGAATNKNFGIAVGGKASPNGIKQNAYVIPEVDKKTLTVVKANYAAKTNFSQILTIKYTEEVQAQAATQSTAAVEYVAPTPSVGDVFKISVYKHGTVPHERNRWYFEYSVRDSDISTDASTPMAITANNIAKKIKSLIEENESIGLTVDVSGAQLTLSNSERDYTIEVSNNITFGTTTHYYRGVGTKEYVEDLAKQCAADKGHFYTHPEAHEFIPGYPDAVENVNYNIYTLRFAVGRNSAKTRDEVVSQIVHIAIPATITATTINTILGVS